MTIDDFLTNMTHAQANKIKEWRCGNPSHSWRRIAHKAALEWDIPEILVEHESNGNKYIDGNQLEGQELCRVAARILGEDVNDISWY